MNGTLVVTDTNVDIQVNLGLLLSTVKPIIERETSEQLTAQLG